MIVGFQNWIICPEREIQNKYEIKEIGEILTNLWFIRFYVLLESNVSAVGDI